MNRCARKCYFWAQLILKKEKFGELYPGAGLECKGAGEQKGVVMIAKVYRIGLTVLLALVIVFSAIGCTTIAPPEPEPPEEEKPENTGPAISADGKVAKESENELHFVTSDAQFNAFINDYFERQIGVTGKKVTELYPGQAEVVWKEWEAKSLMWYDSTGSGDLGRPSGYQYLVDDFRSIPQDNFGYIWASCEVSDTPDGGNSYTYFDQGWPFPSFEHSGATNYGFGSNFNESYLPNGWNVTGASYSMNSGNLVLTPNSGNEVKVTLSGITGGYAFFAPFVETEIKIAGNNSKVLDDLYLEWSLANGKSYSVSYAQAGTQDVDVNDNSSYHYYFNTSVQEGWGKTNDICCENGASPDEEIVSMSLVFKPKDGRSLSGLTISVDYFRTDFDDRCVQTNSIFLSAFAEYYRYTGDNAMLEEMLTKCRKAFQFYLTYCNGASGLIDQDNFVGHDGIPVAGHGISSGYFDILALPSQSFYFNVYYYKAIEAMEYLERMAEAAGINVDSPSVSTSDLKGQEKYNQTAESLAQLLEKTRTSIQNTFWSTEKGRFVEGYIDWEQSGHMAALSGTNVINSNTIDYGYLSFNLEGVAAGVATDEQAKQIMDWVSGEREVSGDTAKGKDEIYEFICSPLITTKRNLYMFAYGGFTGNFGNQVQDGGSAMWVTYYDLIARAQVYGTSNAYERTKEIYDWYEDVSEAYYEINPDGVRPDQFYREYARNNMVSLQGGGQQGALGLDEEFLENAVVVAAYPELILGMDSVDYKVLEIAPNLPSQLTYFKAENLAYQYVKYDCTVGNNFVRIENVRDGAVGSYNGSSEGVTVRITLPEPDGTYQVLIDNTPTTDYKVVNGYVVVEVPFKDCYIHLA